MSKIELSFSSSEIERIKVFPKLVVVQISFKKRVISPPDKTKKILQAFSLVYFDKMEQNTYKPLLKQEN